MQAVPGPRYGDVGSRRSSSISAAVQVPRVDGMQPSTTPSTGRSEWSRGSDNPRPTAARPPAHRTFQSSKKGRSLRSLDGSAFKELLHAAAETVKKVAQDKLKRP